VSLRGSCHCGNVAFTFEGPIPTEAKECNCSICRRKGYLHHFIPRDRFTLETDETDLGSYTFNQHHIQHRFCAICGCSPFCDEISPMEGRALTVAVNLRCVEEIDLGSLNIITVDGASR